MKSNLYAMVLDDWYRNRFNDYTEVKRTSELMRRFGSPLNFLKEQRSLSMNLGRQQGATTAIADFIKQHPELDIRIIFPNTASAKYFSRRYSIDIKKHKLFRGMDVEKIDIIFIDVASYRYMCTTKDKEDLYHSIISCLNTGFNTNQWLISFG